jgi:hypothetical protein
MVGISEWKLHGPLLAEEQHWPDGERSPIDPLEKVKGK